MSQQNSQSQNVDSVAQADDDELEGFNFLKTLGKGNFGKVKLGVHVLTGQYVAIKILEKDLIFEKADIERITRQMKIMKQIRHPYIVQLYEIIEKPKRLYFIMQYADGGDLFDLIVNSQRLGESKAGVFFAQIMIGLEYLHKQGIAHRDMKPENILISGSQIKIADFGLGNFFKQGETLKTACGSPCYASPQMLQRVPYDPQKVDIWSSGIILYAMVCGYLPFEDQVTNKLYEKIKTTNPRFPKFLTDNLKSLLKRILDKNPETRPSIKEIKEDVWLKQFIDTTKVSEFEVDPNKLAKICKIYGINDQEKLAGYLRRNKHNNLTTIYYLACKSKLDEDQTDTQMDVEGENKSEQVQKMQDQTTNNQKPRIQEDDETNLLDDFVESQQTKIPENQIQSQTPETVENLEENVFKYTESEMEPSNNQNPLTQNEQKQNTDKMVEQNQEHVKSQTIQNQVSFGHLEQFENHKQNKQQAQENNNLVQVQKSKIDEQKVSENRQNSDQIANDLAQGNQTQRIQKDQIPGQIQNQSSKLIIKSQQLKPVNQSVSNEIEKVDNLNNGHIQYFEEKEETADFVRDLPQKHSDIQKKAENMTKSEDLGKKVVNHVTKVKEQPLHKSMNLKQINNNKLQKSVDLSKKGTKSPIANGSKTPTSNTSRKVQTNKSVEEESRIKATSKVQMTKSAKVKSQEKKWGAQSPQVDKQFEKKPRLVKTGRMQMVRTPQTNINRKAPLNERSHSRDRTITTKKIIGKSIPSEPFLLDVTKIVLCSWPTLSAILTQRGAEGRVEFFPYGKSALYISKSSLRGIRNLKDIIDKINSKEIY